MALFNKFVDNAKVKLDKFQNPETKVDSRKFKKQTIPNEEQLEEIPRQQPKNNFRKNREENYDEDFYDYNYNPYDDPINLYPAQKPESFHFFILENQYQDLERSIRGVKDVWDKDQNKWVIKRKADHCFTDEESEEIVRTAQTHLSSDIKLAIFSKEEYPILLNSIYDQLWDLFKSIMDYRFGRHGTITKQLEMKLQAMNIFNMLMMRIKANYSRAYQGRENISTHDSVKGQESLNQIDRGREYGRSYT